MRRHREGDARCIFSVRFDHDWIEQRGEDVLRGNEEFRR